MCGNWITVTFLLTLIEDNNYEEGLNFGGKTSSMLSVKELYILTISMKYNEEIHTNKLNTSHDTNLIAIVE